MQSEGTWGAKQGHTPKIEKKSFQWRNMSPAGLPDSGVPVPLELRVCVLIRHFNLISANNIKFSTLTDYFCEGVQQGEVKLYCVICSCSFCSADFFGFIIVQKRKNCEHKWTGCGRAGGFAKAMGSNTKKVSTFQVDFMQLGVFLLFLVEPVGETGNFPFGITSRKIQ